MKKSKLNKFATQTVVNGSLISGGLAGGSDKTFTDSKRDGGKYDIAVESLIDTVDSSQRLDKPQP